MFRATIPKKKGIIHFRISVFISAIDTLIPDISELRTELKSDISGIKVSMAEIKTDILKWMIPFFLTIVALNITTIGIVISYLAK